MKPTSIIIHHSLTKDSETVSWGAIRRYHFALGWKDIGYHAGIELLRDDYEILMGREWGRNGAHCYQGGMNSKSLGLCLVGNFDEIVPPDEQLAVAQKICRYWCKLFDIPKDEIYKHSDFATYKTCPGRLFPWDRFLEGIRNG